MSASPSRSGSASPSDSLSRKSVDAAPLPPVPTTAPTTAAVAAAVASAANGAAPIAVGHTMAAAGEPPVPATPAATVDEFSDVMIHVAGFPTPGTDEEAVREFFTKFGEVTEAKLVTTRDNNRTFGVVTFATAEAAKAAVAADDKTFNGVDLAIEAKRLRRAKKERAPRDGVAAVVADVSNKVHVCDFAPDTDKEALRSHFAQYGEVTSLEIVTKAGFKDRPAHTFATAVFGDADAAKAAYTAEDKTFNGTLLRVEAKREGPKNALSTRPDGSKRERASRGSRGGSGAGKVAPRGRDDRRFDDRRFDDRRVDDRRRDDRRFDDRRRDDRRFDDRRFDDRRRDDRRVDDRRFDDRRFDDRRRDDDRVGSRRERSPARRFDRSPPRDGGRGRGGRERSPARRFDRSPPRDGGRGRGGRERSPARRFDRSPPRRRERSPPRRDRSPPRRYRSNSPDRFARRPREEQPRH